jgi:uracil-DNA glycosylase
MSDSLQSLLDEISACRICEKHLALGPRPVVRASPTARLLIIGQAPGTRVHETGVPWNDASGDRLRDWLGVGHEVFYDTNHIAIMPMGFCYPGRAANGGDNPPRPECAPQWHQLLRQHMKQIEMTLLVGSYAQATYLGTRRYKTMTETVRNWRDYGPAVIPTPHPSWRTTAWLKKNPWFDEEVLPEIRQRLSGLFQINDDL